jgi:hypothetical protein
MHINHLATPASFRASSFRSTTTRQWLSPAAPRARSLGSFRRQCDRMILLKKRRKKLPHPFFGSKFIHVSCVMRSPKFFQNFSKGKENYPYQGPILWFFKYFRRKLAFLTLNKAKLCKILIITSVFEKYAKFFAENWQKSRKIVIITSTPGHTVRWPQSDRIIIRRLRNRSGTWSQSRDFWIYNINASVVGCRLEHFSQ